MKAGTGLAFFCWGIGRAGIKPKAKAVNPAAAKMSRTSNMTGVTERLVVFLFSFIFLSLSSVLNGWREVGNLSPVLPGWELLPCL